MFGGPQILISKPNYNLFWIYTFSIEAINQAQDLHMSATM